MNRSDARIVDSQEKFIVNAILLIEYVLYIIYMMYGSLILLRIGIVIGAAGLLYCFAFPYHYRLDKVFFVLLLYVAAMSLNYMTIGTYSLVTMLSQICIYFSIACLLIRKSVSRKVCLIIFYAIALILAYNLITTGSADFLAKGSRNYVSVVAIVSLFPYFTTFKNDDEHPSLIPVFVCFVLSVLAYGRGGILMASILLLGLCVKSIIDAKSANTSSVLLSIIALVGIIYVLAFTDILEPYLYRFTMDEGGFTDAARSKMWTEYLTQVTSSVRYFITGFPTENSSILRHYLNNLHNSYLMVHYYMGLFGFLVIMYAIVKGMLYMIKTKKYDMLIFMAAFLIRSFTDWVFPMHMGLAVIFYLHLLPIIEPNLVEVENDEMMIVEDNI